jgi:hypothetical protein
LQTPHFRIWIILVLTPLYLPLLAEDSIPPPRINPPLDARINASQDLFREDILLLDTVLPDRTDSVQSENVTSRRTNIWDQFGGYLPDQQPPPFFESSDSLPLLFVDEDCCDNLRSNYQSLKSNPPPGATCVLTDPDVRGFFYRIPNGIPDGATVIRDQLGGLWRRQFPEGYYKLAWWPMGTTIFPNDTIHSAAEALEIILDQSGPGTTIDLAASDSPRTYLLDRPVTLQPFTTIIGQGDTLRRIPTPLGIVTTTAQESDQYIYLESVEGFRKGQFIMVTRGRSRDDVVLPQKRIGAIEGNALIVQGTIGEEILPGDTVIVAFNMFKNSDALNLGEIRFEGVIFDGNWRNNPYTNSWSQNNSISILNNSGSRLSVDRCGVYDTPSENFVAASCRISNSHFKRLAGSIYHVSVVPDTAMNVFLENCWADSICLATNAVTGHSEAAIVTSAEPNNITLSNCDFSNGREGLVGDLGDQVDFVSIINGKFRSFKWIVFGVIGEENLGGEIASNYFENCGQLQWINSGNGAAKYAESWQIHHNEFINTALNISGLNAVQIENNLFKYDATLGGFGYLEGENQLEFPAMVHLSSARFLSFEGNMLIGPHTYQTDLQHGILITSQGNLPGNNPFKWERDIFIRNNTLRGFHKSISTVNTLIPYNFSPSEVREYFNWVITANDILMIPTTTPGSWGIYAAPGVQVLDNRITTAIESFSSTSYPILALGIPSFQGNPNENEIMGAIILRNTILGNRTEASDKYSIYIGVPDDSPDFEYLANVICIDNITSSGIALPPGQVPFHKCMIENNQLIFPKRLTFPRVLHPEQE